MYPPTGTQLEMGSMEGFFFVSFCQSLLFKCRIACVCCFTTKDHKTADENMFVSNSPDITAEVA